MKATYAQLRSDWERYHYGMEHIPDIPPMFIYAWNCGLDRGRAETIDEQPKKDLCDGD